LFAHDGHPINHNNFAKYFIKPYAEKVWSRWNGCYSGRHGAATTLYHQDGGGRAAYQVLGNSLEVLCQPTFGLTLRKAGPDKQSTNRHC